MFSILKKLFIKEEYSGANKMVDINELPDDIARKISLFEQEGIEQMNIAKKILFLMS